MSSRPRLHISAFLAALALLSASCVTSRVTPPPRHVITEAGAVGDGTTVNTRAIQGLIDRCTAEGGGVIVVPKGVFLSGALYFKPGVNLELEKDAVLKSTTSRADFPPIYTSWEGIERYWTSGFLNFVGMKNVVVSGEGTVDGSGLGWGSATAPGRGATPGAARPARPAATAAPADVETTGPRLKLEDVYPQPLPTVDQLSLLPDADHLPSVNAAGIPLPGGGGRLSPPRTIVFQNCTNVRTSGFHLKNQARWGLVFIYCQDVVAEDLNIHIDSYIPSSDGIDICSSRNVSISRCDIACTDDDISIKAGKDADGLRVNRPTENVTVRDCVFGSGGGVDIGSEVSGSIRHVLVERCKFIGTGNAARLKSQPSRGGVVEDVVFRDIEVTNVARVFGFELEWRMVPPIAPAAKVLTVARNIRLIHFTGTAQSVGVMYGLKGSPIQDVKVENSQITAQRGLALRDIQKPDLAGLQLKVAEGPAIMEESNK